MSSWWAVGGIVEGQVALGCPAVEALAVTAHWSFGVGWQFSLQHRHAGSTWGSCAHEVYDHLTTDEMLDVLTASLTATLEGQHRVRVFGELLQPLEG